LVENITIKILLIVKKETINHVTSH